VPFVRSSAMDTVQVLALIPSPIPHQTVWRIGENLYRVQDGKRTLVIEQARIIVRPTGRLRRLGRYLIGRVRGIGIRTVVFLGFLSDAEALDWANRHIEPARASLHFWLDRLIDVGGARVVGKGLGIIERAVHSADRLGRALDRMSDAVERGVASFLDGMMAVVERTANPIFTFEPRILRGWF